MKKVLVTGAAGFIGSHALQALRNSGYKVIACIRNAPPITKDISERVIEADLLGSNIENILRPIRADVVVHCAAVLPAVFHSDDAKRAAELNKRIDSVIINYCRDKGSKFVYISSSSVYGMKGSPWSEESNVSPAGPYASAKYDTEQRAMENMEDRTVILRISAPYGPGQRSGTVMRTFIERALKDLDLQYYGMGSRQQDFTYIDDIASAIVCAVSLKDAKGIFNIASGRPISMKQLAELVLKIIPQSTSRAMASGQPDAQENYRAAFDITRAGDALKWKPAVGLEDGIHRWAEHLGSES